LTADQIAAEDKEKIDPNPTKPIHSTGQFEPEKSGVINDNYDDGERAKKIETRLTFAVAEPRIDRSLRSMGHQS